MIAVGVSVVLATFTGRSVAAECLSYVGEVRLEGLLWRGTFPGPPNWEDIEKGDRPLTYLFLRLARWACVDAEPGHEVENGAIEAFQEIQLVMNYDKFPGYRNLVGKWVHVTGTLYQAFSGYHQTQVLLTVSELQP